MSRSILRPGNDRVDGSIARWRILSERYSDTRLGLARACEVDGAVFEHEVRVRGKRRPAELERDGGGIYDLKGGIPAGCSQRARGGPDHRAGLDIGTDPHDLGLHPGATHLGPKSEDDAWMKAGEHELDVAALERLTKRDDERFDQIGIGDRRRSGGRCGCGGGRPSCCRGENRAGIDVDCTVVAGACDDAVAVVATATVVPRIGESPASGSSGELVIESTAADTRIAAPTAASTSPTCF